eukprot:gene26805-48235_t
MSFVRSPAGRSHVSQRPPPRICVSVEHLRPPLTQGDRSMKTHGFKNGLRWRTILVASSVGLTASAIVASPASAATLFCSGTVGAVTVDSVEVAANDTCRLDGTTVLGSITAHSGATLIANDVQVSGSITGDGVAVLELTGATSVVQGS